MWKCPSCGRSFKNANQQHYCGSKPETIDGYIALQPEEIRPRLRELKDTLQAALPDARQVISWSMPTFRKEHNIIHFAAHKRHIGLYAGTEAVLEFAQELQDYKTSKGTIQFPHDKPLPFDLIAKIASWCSETGNHP